MCILACVVWYITEKAKYASLMMGAIMMFSGWPTVAGVWNNPAIEKPLPWVLWTIAFIVTTINVPLRYREKEKQEKKQNNTPLWMLMVVPVAGIILHATVALFSLFAK